ncbi:hypothetical protein HQ489_05230, partial [Candidatus Woesearchaeota archaeon]|nr:hypothetical protein [Candidatus Woesearchaeota archaeon]
MSELLETLLGIDIKNNYNAIEREFSGIEENVTGYSSMFGAISGHRDGCSCGRCTQIMTGDDFGQIKPYGNEKRGYDGAFRIDYGNLSEQGGDTHETFKIDRYDNPYGHTTIQGPGLKKTN